MKLKFWPSTLVVQLIAVTAVAVALSNAAVAFWYERGTEQQNETADYERFQDRAAQTDLRNVVLGARILYTDNATFSSADDSGTGLVTIVNTMCYVPTAQASVATNPVAPACTSGVGTGSISVASSITQFAAARMSASQTCFVILDGTSGTKYGKTLTPANCTATVYIPAATFSGVTEDGQTIDNAAGVKFLRVDNGRVVLAVGSGAYTARYFAIDAKIDNLMSILASMAK